MIREKLKDYDSAKLALRITHPSEFPDSFFAPDSLESELAVLKTDSADVLMDQVVRKSSRGKRKRDQSNWQFEHSNQSELISGECEEMNQDNDSQDSSESYVSPLPFSSPVSPLCALPSVRSSATLLGVPMSRSLAPSRTLHHTANRIPGTGVIRMTNSYISSTAHWEFSRLTFSIMFSNVIWSWWIALMCS